MYPPTPLEAVLPSLGEPGVNLLERHIVCFPGGRISADEAMKHEYFADIDPALKV